MGARPSGRFSVNEPTRLEFSESCGRSDNEAASTPRSDADKLWMHGIGICLELGVWDLELRGAGSQCSAPNTLARMASLIFQISDIVIAMGRRIKNSNNHWLRGSMKWSANTIACGGCRTWERAM